MIAMSVGLNNLVEKLTPASRELGGDELKELAAKFPYRYGDDIHVRYKDGVLEVRYDYSDQGENSRWHTELKSPITETWVLARLDEHAISYRSQLEAAYATTGGYLFDGQRALDKLQSIWCKLRGEETRRKTVATDRTIVKLPILGLLRTHLKEPNLEFFYLEDESAIKKQIMAYLAEFLPVV